MKHDIAQTSLESYIRLIGGGEMGKRQQQVFTYIAFHPSCSDKEIADGISLPINCVCGRRTELSKMGYIQSNGIKHDDKTNRNVQTWKVL